MENKMNWGTLILGIVVGAVVVSIVWVASKPAVSGADSGNACTVIGGVLNGDYGAVPVESTDGLTEALTQVCGVNTSGSCYPAGTSCQFCRDNECAREEEFTRKTCIQNGKVWCN